MQYWVEQQTGGHIATNSSFLAKTEDSHLSSPWARYISCILVKSNFRRQSCLCYTLNAPKKHHIVDISLNYVNFLLKQPLLHEIHDLLAFHYLKELIFQETTISLSKGCISSQRVPKALQPFNYSKFYVILPSNSSYPALWSPLKAESLKPLELGCVFEKDSRTYT